MASFWYIRTIIKMMKMHGGHLDDVDYAALQKKMIRITNAYLKKFEENELGIDSAILLITNLWSLLNALQENKKKADDPTLIDLYVISFIFAEKISNEDRVFLTDFSHPDLSNQDAPKYLKALERDALRILDYKLLPNNPKEAMSIIETFSSKDNFIDFGDLLLNHDKHGHYAKEFILMNKQNLNDLLDENLLVLKNAPEEAVSMLINIVQSLSTVWELQLILDHIQSDNYEFIWQTTDTPTLFPPSNARENIMTAIKNRATEIAEENPEWVKEHPDDFSAILNQRAFLSNERK